MRRRPRIQEELERASVLRALRALDRSHVALLVIDATTGMAEQDARLATEAWERGRGVVIVLNKWDAVPRPERDRVKAARAIVEQYATLIDVPVLGWFLPKLNVIPVNQESVDRRAIKTIIRVLQAGNGVLVFPEGSRTMDGNLQPGEPGLGLVIAKTLAPVVPMRIFGAREALPRGGGRLHFVPITIVIGEAIVFTAADLNSSGKSLYRNLSERVMEAIATLRLD